MNLTPHQTFADSLKAGNDLIITPSSSASVELYFLEGSATKESLTYAKRYGPYPADMAFRVTVINGDCTVNEGPIDEFPSG